jgi:hypothetical protein
MVNCTVPNCKNSPLSVINLRVSGFLDRTFGKCIKKWRFGTMAFSTESCKDDWEDKVAMMNREKGNT